MASSQLNSQGTEEKFISLGLGFFICKRDIVISTAQSYSEYQIRKVCQGFSQVPGMWVCGNQVSGILPIVVILTKLLSLVLIQVFHSLANSRCISELLGQNSSLRDLQQSNVQEEKTPQHHSVYTSKSSGNSLK